MTCGSFEQSTRCRLETPKTVYVSCQPGNFVLHDETDHALSFMCVGRSGPTTSEVAVATGVTLVAGLLIGLLLARRRRL